MFKGGSLYLGTILKIPVKVHWSFALLLIYVIYVGQQLGMSTFAIIPVAGRLVDRGRQ